MTDKEKAKAYDEAMYRVKHFLTVIGVSPDDEPVDVAKRISEYVFPELKESEDERIINRIKKAVEEYWSDEPLDEILAWLEKRGEQKPAFEMITPEESLGVDSDTYNKIVDECIYGEQKPYGQREECLDCQMNYAGECKGSCAMKRDEQKPADIEKGAKGNEREIPNSAWSEEDECMLYGVIETEQYMLDVVNGIKKFDVGNGAIRKACTEELNFLKSLKERVQPQLHWKPSEEHLQGMRRAICKADKGSDAERDLKDLYEQLKAL